ncbi:hypothetical protein HID58_005747 [Brassica napus]|uniref:Uncharacterized protein n=1 Tax=Brassica napus TaxID=3708 RepID=A0ABQ8ECC4_BRANA|nr:hypothetical protein HID58_005747 [Brassica napus]
MWNVDNLLNKAIATFAQMEMAGIKPTLRAVLTTHAQSNLQHDLREMCDSIPGGAYLQTLHTFWDNYAFPVEYVFSPAYVFDVVKVHVDQSQTLL